MAVNVRRRDGEVHGLGDVARGNRDSLRSRVIEPVRESLTASVHRNLAHRPVVYLDDHIAHLGAGGVDRVRDIDRGKLHHGQGVIGRCDDRRGLRNPIPDDLIEQLIGADQVAVDRRFKVHPKRMRAMGLLGDQVALLPAGYRGCDRLQLHPVQEHMDGLRDSSIRRVREYQHAGLYRGIVKGTGKRQLHNGDREVLDPAVAVGIGDLKLDRIRSGGQIFRHIHRYASLRHIQHRPHHVVDPDRQRPVARGHVVLNGRPGDGQCQGITGSDGPAHKARGIVHGDHGGIGRLCAATSAASPEAGKRPGYYLATRG